MLPSSGAFFIFIRISPLYEIADIEQLIPVSVQDAFHHGFTAGGEIRPVLQLDRYLSPFAGEYKCPFSVVAECHASVFWRASCHKTDPVHIAGRTVCCNCKILRDFVPSEHLTGNFGYPKPQCQAGAFMSVFLCRSAPIKSRCLGSSTASIIITPMLLRSSGLWMRSL